MRLSARFTSIVFLILMSRVTGFPAQSELLQGPILGFTPNSAGSVVWPILGIPGASMLGDPLPLDVEIHGAIISPKQDYALAVRTEDNGPVLIRLADGLATSSLIPDAEPADVFGISPSGLAAAIYNSQSKIVQVIGGLPDAARVIYEFDASNLTSPATHMAVSDDGTIVLVQFASDVDMGFLGFDSSGASWRILLDRPSAATFFANSHDAILADNATSTVFIISDVARTAVQVPLISTLGKLDAVSAVMVSTDNRQVFAADASSGNVLIVDVQTRTAVSVPCQCRLTGLSRLKGNSMVRLNEPSEETMGALDASSANPRIWVTPPATSSTNRPQ